MAGIFQKVGKGAMRGAGCAGSAADPDPDVYVISDERPILTEAADCTP